jgi:hypothetical protein
MDNLNESDLSIDVREEPGVLCLHWRGKSIGRQPQRVLDSFLGEAVEEAKRKALAIEMRFEELVHFNSSTIGCLIQAIQNAQSRGVKLRFVYDTRRLWQRVSFDALRVFTKENSYLELLPVAKTGTASPA